MGTTSLSLSLWPIGVSILKRHCLPETVLLDHVM